MYLTSPCNLYQGIFLSGDVPNYSPTIHPPRHVSFVVRVVNVRFITIAPTQYQARSVTAHVCVCVCDVWVLIIYCRLHYIKWQIPMPLTIYYLGQKKENSVWGEVKFAVCQRRVTVRKCMALVSLQYKMCCCTIYARWWHNITWRFVSSET